jgi:Domain of unknown function (DUF4157)
MRSLATKQSINDVVKQQHGGKGRGRSISPLLTGMPILQRQCACGGGCPRCQDELGMQTKLKISEPGDKYEQQADRIADKVMRMPEPSLQRQVEPEEEEEEEMLQRKTGDRVSTVDSNQESSEVSPIVREVLNYPGQPLDPETRTFMKSRFGYDFSNVRVHADSEAAESAKAINASAYTIGQDIVFGTGQYAPHSTEGRKLLAHELTHTLQQRSMTGEKKIQRTLLRRENCDNITSLPINETTSVSRGEHYTQTFTRPPSGNIRVTATATVSGDSSCHPDNTFGVNVWQCHIVTDEQIEPQHIATIGGLPIDYKISLPTAQWNTYDKFYLRIYTTCDVDLTVTVS